MTSGSRIQALIFDLDGTLVQTERLKAMSYARAAVQLCPHALEEEDVIAAFREVVGRSRQEVAQTLVEKFGLQKAAAKRQSTFGVRAPWQAYVQVRLAIYGEMLADPEILRSHRWPHTLELLEIARRRECRVGLATMSTCATAQHVLKVLELETSFDFIATRDDVAAGKPDPEIYLLVARQLEIAPEACLVVEDSPAGVRSAMAAGMSVVAVSTPFTQEGLHKMAAIPDKHIVDDPDRLAEVVDHVLQHRGERWN